MCERVIEKEDDMMVILVGKHQDNDDNRRKLSIKARFAGCWCIK